MPRGVPRIPEPREWLLTKVCRVCEERKPWAKFSPLEYEADGTTVKYVASKCHKCDAARKNDPVARQAYRDRNVEKLRDYHREKSAKRRADLRREAAANTGLLPSLPLQTFLWERVMMLETPSWDVLASQAGVPDRSIRRVMKQERVSLRLADEICTRLGSHINDVYPDLEEAA